LNEIRDAIGLPAEVHDAPQRSALPKIEAWLMKDGGDVLSILTAAQVLLAEGDLQLNAVQEAARPVRALLSDEWGNIAKPADKLLALKVLILAAWKTDAMVLGNYRALSLAASPWWSLPTRQLGLQKFIDECLLNIEAAVAREQSSLTADAFKQAPPKFDANSFSDAVRAEIVVNPPTNVALEKVAGVLGIQAAALSGLRASFESVRTTLTQWPSTLASTFSRLRAQTEILWWGQARYCTFNRKPLRSLPDHASIRWWAAQGLAASADNFTESAASFLIETLLTLGVSAGEQRSLVGWLEELHGVLRRDQALLPPLSPAFQTHVSACAVGLPVSWLRMHVADAFDPARLREATTLDCDHHISSWQWTSWLLRESMLERLVESET
jgi:hypothetical protein